MLPGGVHKSGPSGEVSSWAVVIDARVSFQVRREDLGSFAARRKNRKWPERAGPRCLTNGVGFPLKQQKKRWAQLEKSSNLCECVCAIVCTPKCWLRCSQLPVASPKKKKKTAEKQTPEKLACVLPGDPGKSTHALCGARVTCGGRHSAGRGFPGEMIVVVVVVARGRHYDAVIVTRRGRS